MDRNIGQLWKKRGKRVGFRIPDETRDRIWDLANKNQCSATDIVNILVFHSLAEMDRMRLEDPAELLR